MSEPLMRAAAGYVGSRLAGANHSQATKWAIFGWLTAYWKGILSTMMVLYVISTFIPYFEKKEKPAAEPAVSEAAPASEPDASAAPEASPMSVDSAPAELSGALDGSASALQTEAAAAETAIAAQAAASEIAEPPPLPPGISAEPGVVTAARGMRIDGRNDTDQDYIVKSVLCLLPGTTQVSRGHILLPAHKPFYVAFEDDRLKPGERCVLSEVAPAGEEAADGDG